MKYYFHQYDDTCTTIDAIKDMMRWYGDSAIVVTPAIREIGGDGFFCTHYLEVGMKGEGTCGKICDHYQPRNGVSGICRHSRNCYEYSTERKKLTL